MVTQNSSQRLADIHYAPVFRSKHCGERQAPGTAALTTTGGNCILTFHQIAVREHMECFGYEARVLTAPTSTTMFRLALYNASETNGCPTTVVQNSNFDTAWQYSTYATAAAIGSTAYLRRLVSTSFKLPSGLYWIGMLVQAPAAGGTWAGNITREGNFGIRDLRYTAATVANANIDTFAWPTNISTANLTSETDALNGNIGWGLLTYGNRY